MSISSEIARLQGNISDSLTAVANKGVTVPSGSNSDDLAGLIAQISGGGTPAISVVDTTDSHGGTIREITGLDISDTTATASDVAQGKWFYNSIGQKTQGTASGGSSIQSGEFTPASDGKTINVSLTGAVTHFIFYSENYPSGVSSGWETVGGVWFNGFAQAFIRYNNTNYSVTNNMTVTATASSLSFTAQYNLISGTKYYWYAW